MGVGNLRRARLKGGIMVGVSLKCGRVLGPATPVVISSKRWAETLMVDLIGMPVGQIWSRHPIPSSMLSYSLSLAWASGTV